MSIAEKMTRLLEAAKDNGQLHTFKDSSGTYYTMSKEDRKYVVRPGSPYGYQNPDQALLFTYAVRKAKSFDDAVAILKKETAPKAWDAKKSMEDYKEKVKLLAKLKKQVQKPASKPAPKKERGVECVRCGREMFNDREYEETDEGPMCSTCGTEEGRWY